ncbi:MAG TPA: lipid-A-disaccharide synthase [Flavobacteriales bacterium]|nr:lipid-A-disaccharide synthase [Flavobacteriales bacterium]
MRYYIIAGEASGDLHGSNLIKELKLQDPLAEMRCWGGDLMEEQGGVIVKHYRDLAFMGFWEVLFNIFTILKNISFCKRDILAYKPDVLILIDYPGFNIRMAKFAKKHNIKVFYYISPQIWAWHQSRSEVLKKIVDNMFVILPFEKEFYKKFDFDVDFVGHPLLDAIEGLDTPAEQREVIALVPGSRNQEIFRMLPVMVEVAKQFPERKFVVAGTSSANSSVYKSCEGVANIQLEYGKTYELLNRAKAALVTSGTATLEAALFNVPEVVCYKGGLVSYIIAKWVIKTKYISLVNLVMDKPVVAELIQGDFEPVKLKAELDSILNEGQKRSDILNDFVELRSKLGGAGASRNTAQLMVKYLSE